MAPFIREEEAQAAAVRRDIPLLDLHALHEPLRDEVLSAIAAVIDSQHFILGEEVARLESEVAAYCGASHAVGCASGSDALLLALRACGVGPGDEVITTPFTFFATAGSISHVGATPVFVDIDPDTYTIDPTAVREALRTHPRVKAIVPVHLYGGSADMDPVLEAAREHGCFTIEDGAQSIGATYKGRPTQSLGDAGCLSFFPSKNLGAFGDGGMVVTNSDERAEELRKLRVHGSSRRYYYDTIGYNSRLDTVQAAVLRTKLRHLDEWSDARARNAAAYRQMLAGRAPVKLPETAPYQTRHIYNQFVIRCPRRDELRSYLHQHGIGTEIYYPLPLHLQACYSHLGYKAGDIPNSETASREVLALPVHPALTTGDIERVASQVCAFYREFPDMSARQERPL